MSWLTPKVTTPATIEPVTKDEVRSRCHIDAGDDDGVIDDMIKVARDHVERYCNLRIGQQSIELQCDDFADFDYLPVGPVRSVASVAYVDAAGTTQTLAGTVYELVSPIELDFAIQLKPGQSWPPLQTGSRITVSVEAGFETVPPAIRGAIFLYVASSYQTPEDTPSEGSTAFDNLLCNFRRGA